jgi:hypothetical protein
MSRARGGYNPFRQKGTHGGNGAKKKDRKERGDGSGCVAWKVTYPTWDEAEHACLRLYLEKGTVTFAYRCEGCNRWHGSKFAPRAHRGDIGAYGTAILRANKTVRESKEA